MYIKKHLGEYVLFQIEQGYDLPDIKNALLRFGYKKPVVKEIFDMLNITVPKKKPAMYSAHDLDQELKVYVQSLLIDYIVKEHKVGYPLEAIKKALINFGHDSAVIDEAILIIETGKVVDYRLDASPIKVPQQIVAPLTIFLIFAFLVFLSIATDTSIIMIIPNFLPLFLTFIIANIAYYFLPKSPLLAAIPLLGVLVTVGIFILGTQYGLLGKAPGSDMILILNAAVAFISTGIVCAFSKKGKDDIVVQIKDKKMRKQAQEEHTLVEDKIHVPKFGENMPKEPYHPKGHPIIPHMGTGQGMHGQQQRHVPAAQPLQQDKDQKNSMLAFLKEGIDKKHVVAQKHPPVSRPPVIVHEAQKQGDMHSGHSHAQKPTHAKTSAVRIMPSSLETLPEKHFGAKSHNALQNTERFEIKEKEKKIPLKQME